MIATRAAAELREEKGVEVELRKGGLGELSAEVDGRRVVDTNRLWYTTPGSVVRKVRATLTDEGS